MELAETPPMGNLDPDRLLPLYVARRSANPRTSILSQLVAQRADVRACGSGSTGLLLQSERNAVQQDSTWPAHSAPLAVPGARPSWLPAVCSSRLECCSRLSRLYPDLHVKKQHAGRKRCRKHQGKLTADA
jgi:hypothetical protein